MTGKWFWRTRISSYIKLDAHQYHRSGRLKINRIVECRIVYSLTFIDCLTFYVCKRTDLFQLLIDTDSLNVTNNILHMLENI